MNICLPSYSYEEFFIKRTNVILLIAVWNEGERIKNQLKRIHNCNLYNSLDIILLDGGSTDGSLDVNFLKDMQVRGVLNILEKGQGCAYRTGFAKAIDEGYQYCITVDGNNKDSIEQIPNFIALLQDGYDFVQGSRFIKGGHHENTPKLRELAIKYFSNPLISFLSGFHYTETMSGFRGFNVNVLKDPRLDIFRDVFKTWELQWYLSSRVPRLGYKVIETPQSRNYPATGPIPTKINWKGNILIIIQLLKVAAGYYNPKKRKK